MKVLVADDWEMVLAAIAEMLRLSGFEVLACDSAEDALKAIDERGSEIGFVITDLDFSGGGIGHQGYDVARAAIEKCGLNKKQVAFLTGLPPDLETVPDDIKACVFLTKPVHPRTIAHIVEAGIRKR